MFLSHFLNFQKKFVIALILWHNVATVAAVVFLSIVIYYFNFMYIVG